MIANKVEKFVLKNSCAYGTKLALQAQNIIGSRESSETKKPPQGDKEIVRQASNLAPWPHSKSLPQEFLE